MKTRSPFVLGLLTSALLAIAPAQAVPVTPTPNPPSSEPAASPVTLTLQDLPAGFQEVPPEIKPQFAAQLENLKQALVQQNLQLDNSFVFVNPDQIQLVLGFTGMLRDQPQQAKFDAGLQELQQPEARQQLISKVQKGLQSVQGIEVVGYEALPELNNLADESTGMTLALKMQGIPVRMQIAGFRRSQVGSFTAVLYLDGAKPVLPVKDVVSKLDNRILQSSPSANTWQIRKAVSIQPSAFSLKPRSNAES